MDVDHTADPLLDPAVDPQMLDADTVVVSNPAQRAAEVAQARRLAERYRLDYVDMATFQIDSQLFRAIPAELMLRYGFVPARREGNTLVIVVSDPSDLPQIDEIALQLKQPVKVMVGCVLVASRGVRGGLAALCSGAVVPMVSLVRATELDRVLLLCRCFVVCFLAGLVGVRRRCVLCDVIS
jgi:hypothetical protein